MTHLLYLRLPAFAFSLVRFFFFFMTMRSSGGQHYCSLIFSKRYRITQRIENYRYCVQFISF